MSVIITYTTQVGNDLLISGLVNNVPTSVSVSNAALALLPNNASRLDVLQQMLIQQGKPGIRRSEFETQLAMLFSLPAFTVGGNSITGTITLANVAAEDTTIHLGITIVNQKLGSTLPNIPQAIFVPQGASGVTFSFPTVPSNKGVYRMSATMQRQLNITTVFTDFEIDGATTILQSISLPASVVHGNPFTLTATLSQLAFIDTLVSVRCSVVNPKSNASTPPDVPAAFIIPQGQTSGSVTVQTAASNTGTFRIVCSALATGISSTQAAQIQIT